MAARAGFLNLLTQLELSLIFQDRPLNNMTAKAGFLNVIYLT
jgi:hypothetical protein